MPLTGNSEGNMRGLSFSRRLLFVGILMLISGLTITSASCRTVQPENGKIGVVVTILPLADFVQHIGGDAVAVTVMVPPGASPHTHEPTPGQMVQVQNATVYVKAGSGVEFERTWMDKILKQNPDLQIIDCSNGITIKNGDPHIWNSPVNAMTMAESIGQGLADMDADNADLYLENMQRYIKSLKELDGDIHKKIDSFANRAFLIYHPAFAYLAAEYGMDQIAIEHGGKEPTPKLIQESIELADRYNLQYVFAAPQFSTVHAESIAKAIDGQVVLIDPLPERYIENMDHVTDALASEFE
jgi:zinc transport system substrate-binding protein